jgi:hypothetical protein
MRRSEVRRSRMQYKKLSITDPLPPHSAWTRQISWAQHRAQSSGRASGTHTRRRTLRATSSRGSRRRCSISLARTLERTSPRRRCRRLARNIHSSSARCTGSSRGFLIRRAPTGCTSATGRCWTSGCCTARAVGFTPGWRLN